MTDASHMARALRLATKGRGFTSPDPAVGCVLVQDGALLAQVYHRRAGQPPVVLEALHLVNNAAPGATLYVTMEPSLPPATAPHWVRVVVGAGVKRVVVGTLHPVASMAGRGIQALKDAGLAVQVGVLEDRCRLLNEAWGTFVNKGRPFVTLKGAMSLDGKIATHQGQSQWITSEVARRYVHQLRGEFDAILVGVGTAAADNPRLTVRHPRWKGKTLLRVVLDSRCSLSPTSHLADVTQSPTLVFTTDLASPSHRQALLDRGVEVVTAPSVLGQVDVGAVLTHLGGRGIVSLLVEGGSQVAASFALTGRVDQYLIFVAPRVIGGVGARSLLGGEGVGLLKDTPQLQFRTIRRVGPDLLVEALPAQGRD